MTPVAASPATATGSPDMTAEIKAASGTGLPLKPGPSLKSVLQDISASLEDLQAGGKRGSISKSERVKRAAAEPTPGSADRGYQDLFGLSPRCLPGNRCPGFTIVASNQAAAATLKVDPKSPCQACL